MSGWTWRKAAGGILLDTDTPTHRRFHACDSRGHAACSPYAGLAQTCEPPNEGSDLCSACVDVVKTNPAEHAR
jgi:hypothetical protein